MIRTFVWILGVLLIPGVSVRATDDSTGSKMAADRVFIEGAIHTMNSDQPRVDAVAIKNGEIIFVGSKEAANDYIGESTVVTKLDGKMLMPGFHDAHAHILAGGISETQCNLQDVRDQQQVLKLLETCREKGAGKIGDWVTGNRWALAAFPEGNPRKEVLDEIFGDRPVYLVDTWGHSAWVSSRALQLAGINGKTPNPPQGVIEKDSQTGEPTGTLRDGAMQLVQKQVPEPTLELLTRALRIGMEKANAFGITSYIEPGLNAKHIAAYLELDRTGGLTARVLVSLAPDSWDAKAFGTEIFDLVARREEFRRPYLSPDSVKIYADGVPETHTAYLVDGYADGAENFPPFYSPETLNDFVQKLDAQGLQVHIHATGDNAVRMALNAFEYAISKNGRNDNRHHIVHVQMVHPEDIPRFGKLGVAANFQSLWAYYDEYTAVATRILGPDRVNRYYPIGSILRSGGMIVGGSDWDVSSLNPLDAIEVGVRRQIPDGDSRAVFNEAERVSLNTMLQAYTSNAAYVMRQEILTGTIEVGKRADLIVLDRDLLQIPVTEINEANVLLTLVNGKEVYKSPQLQTGPQN